MPPKEISGNRYSRHSILVKVLLLFYILALMLFYREGRLSVNKQDYLYKLRRCKNITTLDKVIERNKYLMPDKEFIEFLSAADHRYAEIKMDKLYDRIPKSVWSLV
jgi:hemolysin expression modulating protein